ncbi:unnamed protein product [Mytilus edulis]|uniref:Uncharacterized protein n=1 Tax=Mytilus edulis TaxID=6550 RepID=A0A8S3TAE1_MYTED|nr:unnamed protein product [Mytilus edulis]
MNSLYLLLEEGYVGVLPMRSIGPLQWTKSKFNHHDRRDKNYHKADLRAEILLELLDNKLVDKKQEKVFHDEIVHPYEFIKLNGKVEVSNTERKDLSPKRLLKTPEGILEAKQLTLILAHKEFSTITIEEPDRDAEDKKTEHNKKTTIDKDAKNKTSNADTIKKTYNEGAKKKTSYEDTTMKTSNKDAKKKTSNIDSKKEISYEETKKKISNEDDKRNTNKTDAEPKTSHEDPGKE